MSLTDYGPKPGGPTHPPQPPTPPPPPPRTFRPPLPRTPLNALIACGRALGPAVLAVARLFAWRTS